MRAFLVGIVLAGTAIIAVGSCSLDGDGTGSTLGNGQGNGTGTGGTGAGNMGTPCDKREDCPPDGDCAVYSCNNGFCAPSFAPAGSEVSGSVVGDCKRVTCTATGVATPNVDDTDVPAGDDCRVGSCNAGTPVLTPKEDETPCGTNDELECLAGACVGCSDATDCEGAACLDPVCIIGKRDNTCGTMPKPAGATVNDPSNADCTYDACDGGGNVLLNVADPDDVPSDGLECTNDACNGAIPEFLPKVNGDVCTQGGGQHCFDGACLQCGVAENCPDTECQVPVCNAGTCAPTNEPDGITCTMGGDYCYQGQCAQCSMTSHCPTTECQPTTACNAGTCMPNNAPNGTACGSGQFCFNGTCSECGVFGNCPAAPVCNIATCTNGTCGMMPIADNTPCPGNSVCCSGTCCPGGTVACNGTVCP